MILFYFSRLTLVCVYFSLAYTHHSFPKDIFLQRMGNQNLVSEFLHVYLSFLIHCLFVLLRLVHQIYFLTDQSYRNMCYVSTLHQTPGYERVFFLLM